MIVLHIPFTLDLIEMNRLKIEGDVTMCDGCLSSKEKGNYFGAPRHTNYSIFDQTLKVSRQ